MATRCCASTTRDFDTVTRRVEHEGLSFLTITLPSFGKSFERCLANGRAESDSFPSFRKRTSLPLFLRGLMTLVFDADDGCLLNNPSIDAIQAIRQLTLMYGKMLLPCTSRREKAAFDRYVETDRQVGVWTSKVAFGDLLEFKQMSNFLFRGIYVRMDHDVAHFNIIPKHGPGATADRIVSNDKFNSMHWTKRLDRVFPVSEYAIPNHRFINDLEEITCRDPGTEEPVRVVSVPKTLVTPRIIGIEPTCMQFMQQGVLDSLKRNLLGHHEASTASLIKDFIGFDDQTPNQRMARLGSIDGSLATLDLSDASDRVPNVLVETMLSDFPSLSEGVSASRSLQANVPERGVIPLSKYASMGSALCFPFEAMVFLTCVFMGISEDLKRPLTQKLLKSYLGQVRIFGDDIVVPKVHARSVIRQLERFNARVNEHKSFETGKFRESCGAEFYNGTDVTIVRVRQEFPLSRKHVDRVVSLASLRNQLYYAGLWRAVKMLDMRLESLLRYFPIVAPSSTIIGRHSVLPFQASHIGEHDHRPKVKGWVKRDRIPPSHLDGYGALFKFFLKRGPDPSFDEKHLERAGRPESVSIILRNASAD